MFEENQPIMYKKHLVAIIVLNHNKKEDLLECLNSIFKQDYKEFEVIVVDNGSRDGSVDAIKNEFPNIHLIESEINLGVAGGRNLGIRFANEKFNYKFILFLDNDVIVEKYALSEMVKSFDLDKTIGIVTPKCYIMNMPGIIGYAGGMSVNLFTGKIVNIGGGKKDEGQYDQSKFISSCGGLCLVSNELISKVGLFDENFNPYGWEDVDFSIRAKEKSFKIFYNHRAIIYHKGGKKGRGKAVDEYEFYKVKNYFYLIKKHANILQLITIFSVLPFKTLILILKQLTRGEYKIVYTHFRSFLSLFK
ncbi:MAG: glycosyltransferase family 2 protein [Ignavibacteria bacterium]|nr:glycosyltransferase family 2 protein [Ignavibacteria bacterium]